MQSVMLESPLLLALSLKFAQSVEQVKFQQSEARASIVVWEGTLLRIRPMVKQNASSVKRGKPRTGAAKHWCLPVRVVLLVNIFSGVLLVQRAALASLPWVVL